MQTIRSPTAISSTSDLPTIVTARAYTRARTSAVERRMLLNVPGARLWAARGGARMEYSGASSRTISIGRPQWRHAKVGGFVDSESSLAATSLAVIGAGSTDNSSNCRAAARLSRRLPLASSP